MRRPARSTLLPYTTLFPSVQHVHAGVLERRGRDHAVLDAGRSEEHTSELQSRQYLVCRLLLEKKSDAHAHVAAQVNQLLNCTKAARHVRSAMGNRVQANLLFFIYERHQRAPPFSPPRKIPR